MAKIIGGVVVTGFISPSDTGDSYAVIDPIYGIDGLRNYSGGTSVLNTIPTLRRRAGMFVGVNDGAQVYQLKPAPWNNTITDWNLLNFTGSTTLTHWSASTGSNAIVTKNSENIALGNTSLAEGFSTIAGGDFSHAEGSFTLADGVSSHAEGEQTQALGDYSHAEGASTKAIGDYTHTEGESTSAGWKGFIASGITDGLIGIPGGIDYTSEFSLSGFYNAEILIFRYDDGYIAHYDEPTALSFDGDTFYIQLNETYIFTDEVTVAPLNNLNSGLATSETFGNNSHSEGSGSMAIGKYSHAEGYNNLAIGVGSHAEGNEPSEGPTRNIASGNASHAEGFLTTASGAYSHAEGSQTNASGGASHTEGFWTNAVGGQSHAEGTSTTAIGNNSHSEGESTSSGWQGIEATGITNGVIGVIGNYFQEFTNGNGFMLINTLPPIIEEYSTFGGVSVVGDTTYIQLNNTGINSGPIYVAPTLHLTSFYPSEDVLGNRSHAEGYYTIATGENSHSEGFFTYAIGENTHAEGNHTIASGPNSHAEGSGTTASGPNSHAGGQNSIASGEASFVHGNNSQVNGYNSIVLGANITGNTTDTTYVDNLNIKNITGGPSVNNLGVDAGGKVVIGSGGGGGISNTSAIGNVPQTTSGGNLIDSLINQDGNNINIGVSGSTPGTTTTITFEDNTLDPLISVSTWPWYTQSNVTRTDNYAAKSGDIIEDETTTMTYVITAPTGTTSVSLYYKVSSEEFWDFLTIQLNGVDVISPISGEVDWTNLTFDLVPSSVNTIDFIYSKDGSSGSGVDAAYIDDIVVSFPTGETISFIGNLISPVISATTYLNLPENNFVRDLIININDLPNPYTEQDVCDYVLGLPENERTIAQTDSKWNVIIASFGS